MLIIKLEIDHNSWVITRYLREIHQVKTNICLWLVIFSKKTCEFRPWTLCFIYFKSPSLRSQKSHLNFTIWILPCDLNPGQMPIIRIQEAFNYDTSGNRIAISSLVTEWSVLKCTHDIIQVEQKRYACWKFWCTSILLLFRSPFSFFLVSALFQNCFLCWDHWNGTWHLHLTPPWYVALGWIHYSTI